MSGRTKIEHLQVRGSITVVQMRAGLMWRGDYLAQAATGLEVRGYAERRPMGTADHGYGYDERLTARRRYRQAGEALGPLRTVLHPIVCGDQDLKEVAAERGEPITAVTGMLRCGLDWLAGFYEVNKAA